MTVFVWDLDAGENYAIHSTHRNEFYTEAGDLYAEHRDREALGRSRSQSTYSRTYPKHPQQQSPEQKWA